MKLILPAGMTLEKALQALKSFYENNTAGYDVLRTDCLIEIELRSRDRKVCPENDSVFRFTGAGEVADVNAVARGKTEREVNARFVEALEARAHAVETTEEDVRRKEKTLARSIEKGFKSVEKNRKTLTKLKFALSRERANHEFWSRAWEAASNGTLKVREYTVNYNEHDDAENPRYGIVYQFELDGLFVRFGATGFKVSDAPFTSAPSLYEDFLTTWDQFDWIYPQTYPSSEKLSSVMYLTNTDTSPAETL